MIDTGSVTGGPQDQVGARRRRACRTAKRNSSSVRASVSAPTTSSSTQSSQQRAVGDVHGPHQRPRRASRSPAAPAGSPAERPPSALGDRGEPVSALLHLRDEPVEGGDGLRPVAAGVVQQHDRAGVALRRGVAHDRVDAGPRPVPAVGVVETVR